MYGDARFGRGRNATAVAIRRLAAMDNPRPIFELQNYVKSLPQAASNRRDWPQKLAAWLFWSPGAPGDQNGHAASFWGQSLRFEAA